jgi:hypothetical protein
MAMSASFSFAATASGVTGACQPRTDVGAAAAGAAASQCTRCAACRLACAGHGRWRCTAEPEQAGKVSSDCSRVSSSAPLYCSKLGHHVESHLAEDGVCVCVCVCALDMARGCGGWPPLSRMAAASGDFQAHARRAQCPS